MSSILTGRRERRLFGMVALVAIALMAVGSASAVVGGPQPPQGSCPAANAVVPCGVPAPACTANAVRGDGDSARPDPNAVGPDQNAVRQVNAVEADANAVRACGAAHQVVSVQQAGDRYGYCAAAGDTMPDGAPILPGTFLNLLLGQPLTDSHYTGATPAFYVKGVGIKCSLTTAQRALISSSIIKVNHVGKFDDPNEPNFYILIG